MRPLLRAVLHAQKPPILHLDLKSANVVLDAALTPKLADFGIAALGNDLKAITSGSPAYSASFCSPSLGTLAVLMHPPTHTIATFFC